MAGEAENPNNIKVVELAPLPGSSEPRLLRFPTVPLYTEEQVDEMFKSKCPRVHHWTPEEVRKNSRPYATNALRFLNNKQPPKGPKYMLVDPGRVTSTLIRGCCIHHMNFTVRERTKKKKKGKRKRDADNADAGNADADNAPVLVCFAELITRNDQPRIVQLCEVLGTPDSLPEVPLNHGCNICRPRIFHHPPAGGFRILNRKNPPK